MRRKNTPLVSWTFGISRKKTLIIYVHGAKYAYDFLKDSKFEESAKSLMDQYRLELQDIETSQAIQRPILEHISAYRANKSTYNDAEKDVETLEKLLSVFREDIEKSKVENVLQKIQSFEECV